jgi:hypothetical protein
MRFIVTKCKLDHAYLAAVHGKVDCDEGKIPERHYGGKVYTCY